MTNLREMEIRGPFKIEDFNTEELDKNPPIIQSIYLRSVSILFFNIFDYNERIDSRHLAHLLSSCVSSCKLSLRSDINKLPEYHYLSSDLAYIHLKGCRLREDPMPTLEKLPNLRIVEVGEEAFIGKKMFCSAQGFSKLESLSLERLYSFEEWKVDEGAMPSLRKLAIRNCRRLKMLPDGLRFVTTLQELKIESMGNAFKNKVVQGGQDFYEVQHIPSIIFLNCRR